MRPPPLHFEDLGRPDSCLSGGGDGSHADATLKRGMLSGGRKDGKGVSRKQSMHQKIFGGGEKQKIVTKNEREGGEKCGGSEESTQTGVSEMINGFKKVVKEGAGRK
nr:Protein TOCA-1, isoform a [Haemonchus contortus]